MRTRLKKLLAPLLCALLLAGCARTGNAAANEAAGAGQASAAAEEPSAATRMELRYADQFTVEFDAQNRALVTVGDARYLLVPPGAEPPADADTDATVLRVPMERIYVADSSAMDFFARLDALSSVRLTGTKRNDWTIDAVRRAMDAGEIRYAGKYAAPDYELLLSEKTTLAIENTMIYHSPETKEQLERLGIPVFISRASYESHPLGRLEWIKLYGLLVGREAEAEAFFNEQSALAESVAGEDTGRSAAFFYLGANGVVNVRRANDYIPRMIALAGGRYVIPDDGDDGARATMNMEAEAFYALARNADVLFYNATVDGGVQTRAQLVAKAGWLADCKAVQSGDVWCTEADLYQRSSAYAEMIAEFHRIFGGTAETGEPLRYFHKLS